MAKAKSKSSIDFKQVLMQHGERIGLAAAAVICALLIVTSLFMPGSGLFAPSPDEKAKYLKDKAQAVNSLLMTNQPQPDDLPPPDAAKNRIALEKSSVDANKYMLASLVAPDTSGSAAGRRFPTIFTIDEAAIDLARVQIRSYVLDKSFEKIECLELGGDEEKINPRVRRARRGFGRGPIGPGGPGGPGRPGGPGMGGPGMGGPGMGGPPMPGSGSGMPGVEGAPKEKRPVLVSITDLDKKAGVVPAIQIIPRRMAVIAASFPYKKQVEEFRNRLGLKSVNDVLSEGSTEKADAPLHAFRFLGVDVQRRELDGDGNPVKDRDGKPIDWQLLNIADDYRPYRVHTGGEPELDDPSLAQLTFSGLVMPKVKQFREEEITGAAAGMAGPMGSGGPPPGSAGPPPGGGPMGGGPMGGAKAEPTVTKTQYPPVEDRLENLKKTLKALKEKGATAVAAPKTRFNADGFDPFAPTAPPTAGAGGPGAPPMPGSPGGPGAPMPGGPGGPGETGSDRPMELPDHCLVRVIDMTVQPGRSYEYRVRVRMANPNFGRRDVANPRYAEDKELASAWSTVPIRMRVDPELHYYAVDQRMLDREADPRDRYQGPYARLEIDPERTMLMQAHRWLTYAKLGGKVAREIGEWSVAERFPVHRGEYVGRRERTKVPVWYRTRETFMVPSDDNARGKKQPGIEVDFGVSNANSDTPEPLYPREVLSRQPEAILVDFEQGTRSYERVLRQTEDRTDFKKVTDTSAVQALVLNPDGKLALLEGGRDVEDTEREKRMEEVRARVKEVEKRSKPAGGGGVFGGN